MKIQLGIDFGGSYVSICKKGESIVFKEPSLISVQGGNSKYRITAMGNNAKKNQSKIFENILVFSPFSEGLVKSVDYASLYLKYALSKIFKSIPYSKLNCLLALPLGISQEEEDKYIQVFTNAGIKSVKTVKSVICSGFASQINSANFYPMLIADIGGSKTDVAVINNKIILQGATLGLGGTSMDNSIVDTVRKKYKLEVDEITAEMIKENIGSLYSNDTLNIEVVGIDLSTQAPNSCVVYSKDIRESLIPYFEEIVKVIKATLADLSEETALAISKNELILTGGITGISGIEQYFSGTLGIKTAINEYAENSVIIGLSKLI